MSPVVTLEGRPAWGGEGARRHQVYRRKKAIYPLWTWSSCLWDEKHDCDSVFQLQIYKNINLVINSFYAWSLSTHSGKALLEWASGSALLNEVYNMETFANTMAAARSPPSHPLWLEKGSHGLSYVPQNSYVRFLTWVPQNVIIFGDRVFTEITKVKWGHEGGP